ncbi:polysaccharide pyruvyl transferase family protein [Rarobacter incanus]|uniref:Pyruvyl transferase n=1 Tax=Rarobacter incanus TaxID=153494 RepID=A0A542SNK0_9MICO|nr:polysaccharide pyruvyl transferase family protein [Rarobacter incanus]TQK76226.1 pyruvyl transferase [Rarobacter incanus]
MNRFFSRALTKAGNTLIRLAKPQPRIRDNSRGGSLLHQDLLDRYQVSRSLLVDADGNVPARWWLVNDNFGDLLSPWILEQISGRKVVLADRTIPHYVAIGSIAKHIRPNSVVWGTGSFGTEGEEDICPSATYAAVRGPLTRSRLQHFGAKIPAIYGDPALLTPAFYFPRVEITHEVGMVTRWSERNRQAAEFGPGVAHITLDTTDIEGTLRQILACKRIVTSSLHGLIIADAYGIPSAWISSGTPRGGEFKFYDYFATVNKFRKVQHFSFTSAPVTVKRVLAKLCFDGRPIQFNFKALLDTCPLLERK